MIPTDLDEIYTLIDRLMAEHRLVELDVAIAAVNVHDFSTDNLLGVLTASLPVKSSLPSRPGFYKAVEQELTARGQMGPGLLRGLE